jgi:trimethylamine:corrinoid methyltransferase-like protein
MAVGVCAVVKVKGGLFTVAEVVSGVVMVHGWAKSDCTLAGEFSAYVKVQGGAMYSGWGVSADVKV